MKKEFSVERIVGALKQAEVGMPLAESIRKTRVKERNYYPFKAKYAGLETDQPAVPCMFSHKRKPDSRCR